MSGGGEEVECPGVGIDERRPENHPFSIHGMEAGLFESRTDAAVSAEAEAVDERDRPMPPLGFFGRLGDDALEELFRDQRALFSRCRERQAEALDREDLLEQRERVLDQSRTEDPAGLAIDDAVDVAAAVEEFAEAEVISHPECRAVARAIPFTKDLDEIREAFLQFGSMASHGGFAQHFAEHMGRESVGLRHGNTRPFLLRGWKKLEMNV